MVSAYDEEDENNEPRGANSQNLCCESPCRIWDLLCDLLAKDFLHEFVTDQPIYLSESLILNQTLWLARNYVEEDENNELPIVNSQNSPIPVLRLVDRHQLCGGNLKLIGHVTNLVTCKNFSALHQRCTELLTLC